MKVADNKLFIHWIMAMGDNFKIIGPENLVKEVHDELNRLAKQYEHTDQILKKVPYCTNIILKKVPCCGNKILKKMPIFKLLILKK